ncbi:MAG: hypothetical protein OXF07_09690 [Rhodobacter sp.]|nr:hypothetical protein [Rhodobacter sp.]
MIDWMMHMFRAAGAALWEALAPSHGVTDTCSGAVLTGPDDGHLDIIAGSPDRRIAGSPDRRIAGFSTLVLREGHGRVRMAVPPSPASLSA